MNKITKLLYVLICWTLFSGAAVAGGVYRLSMLPRYYPERILAMITPLAEYIGKETGASVTPVLTPNYTEYENRMKDGEIQIGYENPLVYTKISQQHEVLAIAVKGEGGERFRGIVITRPDSDILTIADLRHKKIMIVGRTSAGGFLSQKLFLEEGGIDVDADCDLKEAAGNKQENVIIAVSVGDVDAGFIRESALHVADAYIQPGSIKTMVSCAWLPNWAFSVNKNMPDALKFKIQKALLSLKKDSDVLSAMNITAFKSAKDEDYDVIRRLVAQP